MVKLLSHNISRPQAIYSLTLSASSHSTVQISFVEAKLQTSHRVYYKNVLKESQGHLYINKLCVVPPTYVLETQHEEDTPGLKHRLGLLWVPTAASLGWPWPGEIVHVRPHALQGAWSSRLSFSPGKKACSHTKSRTVKHQTKIH